ncbi:Ig-like domain-containing protein [Bacillus sp. AFS088145]|uniref:Ig-like domain-containing protein n=1 Tax=Bacillus sp. AFS088145 TaxID=2033514 RepID=UPI000BF509FB|nr:Ig-like domain-containing protein [Bacillus sp. AFS088145]PFH86935.1 protease [Bacillus sp. AFS088145]
MMKKGILSLATLGLLASPLSFTTAHAEVNNYELLKKASENQVVKPLPAGINGFHTFNDSSMTSKLTHFTAKPSINLSSYGATEADNEYYEVEYNDDFDSANDVPLGGIMYGQLTPRYDMDFFKIVVPSDGEVLLTDTTFGPQNITLFAGLFQKDFASDDKLVLTDYEYDEETDMEYLYYQVKAGTYYVSTFDLDDEEYDDNTPDDYYGFYTLFNDNVAPAKPTVNKVDNNDLVVTGKAEANSTVTVKNGSTVLGTVKATSAGTYSVAIAKAQSAGATISVTAKDSAGNTSVAGTTKVVDVIAPGKPSVNRVDNNDKVVTGKAEANSTVTVKKGTTTLGTIKATSTGTFSVTIPVQYAGTTLTVTAKDAAGNTSAGTSVVVVDVIPPAKPTINRVDDNDLKVTGKAEKGSTVTVKRGTTVLGSTTADSYGNYSVKIAAQKKGTVISVTAKDKAGNTSAAATYTVVKH